MRVYAHDDFDFITNCIEEAFKTNPIKLSPLTWQGIDVSNKPDMVTYELKNVSIEYPLNYEYLDAYRESIKPNLPWADDHFEERVCGYPINPGIQWENWPWANSANSFRSNNGMFNHNYMERYWCKYPLSNIPTKTPDDFSHLQLYPIKGIREEWGDLNDLGNLLIKDPYTRKAYLPIFFPEDTGKNDRSPCTLGYQFLCREGKLDIIYPMRSCDYVRHFRDDVYLTIRLLIWMLEKLKKTTELHDRFWKEIKPGSLTMHMTSLHIFANDYIFLTKDEE